MKCPQCEFENRPQAKFCKKCASPLTRICANCGTVRPGSRRMKGAFFRRIGFLLRPLNSIRHCRRLYLCSASLRHGSLLALFENTWMTMSTVSFRRS